ncbi:isochorismate synthase [Schaalia sp. ZJ405]|uniref:isochorismate synthase n=1 Tax=Schaalia sp. ZJ405 TaxID=2709403 RepID=UPI0013E9A6C6|nr:isochorismate synthase [Schaalia sp. ZJ405]QPK81574.1 isochorismate synthase [Schaalia sp. ZJ405]
MHHSVSASFPLAVRVERIPSSSPLRSVPLDEFLLPGVESCAWFGPRLRAVGFGSVIGDEDERALTPNTLGMLWRTIVELVRCPSDPQPSDLQFPLAFISEGFHSRTPSAVVIPRTLIVDVEDERWVATTARTRALDEVDDPLEAARHLHDEATSTAIPLPEPTELSMLPGRMTQDEWRRSVTHIIDKLNEGAASKVVMARDLSIRATTPLSVREIVSALGRHFPTTWRFSVAGLVGATPEMLASASNGRFRSRILAGTAPAGRGEDLMNSDKNRREHRLAVRSVTDALDDAGIPREEAAGPFILDLPNVAHLASDIEGSLDGRTVLDVVHHIHPTAAVCGTPRARALALLDECERTERGRYSGPVGWMDHSGEGEIALALRCGQLSDDALTLRVFAGCGIMPDSDPRSELAETRAKMAPLLTVLGVE